MIGEMRVGFASLAIRLDTVERATAGIKMTIIATVIPTGIAVVAIVVAVLTFGQAGFGIGISTRDVIRATVAEMVVARTAQTNPASKAIPTPVPMPAPTPEQPSKP
jgi:hypothetical protein